MDRSRNAIPVPVRMLWGIWKLNLELGFLDIAQKTAIGISIRNAGIVVIGTKHIVPQPLSAHKKEGRVSDPFTN